MIEYRCDREWVTAAWRGYEARAPLDWPDDQEYMTTPEVVDVILTASDEARLELTWQINSSNRDCDSKGERK